MDRGPNLDGLIATRLADGRVGGPDAQFAVIEWSDPGDGEWEWIAPLHVHHRDDEAWYVLEGALRFKLADEEVRAEAGAAVFAPRGMPHAYGNAARAPARYLLITTQRILALVDELHAAGADPADYDAIFRKYDSELLR
jgi:mannose-6-phosphate isomerase-like protein (cupin superfamily)